MFLWLSELYDIFVVFMLDLQGRWKHEAAKVDKYQRFHLSSCGKLKGSDNLKTALIFAGSV